ncbi:Druantia anti-phage system protein DruA [Caldicellulosiruptor acetigenus]|uniref:Druantia anti-phage system protein DruA n=1 Tax=Caldicellulosiruptor acetigenus TaxID=301953 RepID=UPI00040624D1|nr:Druantia anti-phage system protein DruA [Caldicellulosiruptor acetigenus]WAM36927.1 DUF4338 domain-containing protein [Caldicellulosiruptor acetigenus]
MYSKEIYRRIHIKARNQEIIKHSDFIMKKGRKIVENYFADGHELDVRKIKPVLYTAEDGEMYEIFKTTRFVWSLPYTSGYGRRLRFVVMDDYHKKIIGILGLHSPVLGLKPRNEWLGLRGKDKTTALNQTMDIYTLGAVPPYSFLLGGKLMAMTAVTNEVREAYKRKYKGKTTIINGEYINGELVLLTTTSAFGRSSLYNRVKYKDRYVCFSVGYTTGLGVSHIPDAVFHEIKEYLLDKGIEVKSGYGNGPNYKFRLINAFLKEASKVLNLKEILEVDTLKDVIRHGIPRQVYVFPLAENIREYLHGVDDKPKYFDYPFEQLAQYWYERYLIPRSTRNTEWLEWKKEKIIEEWKEILGATTTGLLR